MCQYLQAWIHLLERAFNLLEKSINNATGKLAFLFVVVHFEDLFKRQWINTISTVRKRRWTVFGLKDQTNLSARFSYLDAFRMGFSRSEMFQAKLTSAGSGLWAWLAIFVWSIHLRRLVDTTWCVCAMVRRTDRRVIVVVLCGRQIGSGLEIY